MIQKLSEIQKNLKAFKTQYNSFGKYHYRSCEDILEAVKPLLNGLILYISDDVIQVGNRVYIRATVTLTDGEKSITNTAWAREEEDKKGMDGSQITGAASSYARKYALNGLFLIDDNKDSDSTNEHGKGKVEEKKAEFVPQTYPPAETPITADEMRKEMAEWFGVTFGLDSIEKFKEMTGGNFNNPLTIKTDKNVAIAYNKYLAYKGAHNA